MATERERIDILADFISTTSHELRTPLSVINTSLYMLMRSDDEVKRQQKADQISNQVTYLNNMINQLHEAVRLDRIHELELIPLSFESSIKAFLDHYLTQNPHVNIVSHIALDVPLILGDRVYIDTILTHLVNNAVHFSDEGNRIELNVTLEGGMVALRVKDYGIGIAPQHLSQIFNPFYKVNPARTQGENGVGVGLTIVKRLMQLHHGRVEVESKLGEGAVFTVYFPIAPLA
ncbi:MAG: HAMP domain-containing sensor histidine kinase [bacterium]|nr:HAMP domain-containing sensor histidine kinase [bacterium]